MRSAKANAICELYRTKKYSQDQIAKMVGCVLSYVSKVVNRRLTLDELAEIGEVLQKRKGAWHPKRGKNSPRLYRMEVNQFYSGGKGGHA